MQIAKNTIIKKLLMNGDLLIENKIIENIKKGDIIYIYCSKPIQKILFISRVEEINLKKDKIQDDKDLWKNQEDYEKQVDGKFFRVKLVDNISDKNITLKKLLNNGLKAARRVW